MLPGPDIASLELLSRISCPDTPDFSLLKLKRPLCSVHVSSCGEAVRSKRCSELENEIVEACARSDGSKWNAVLL